MASDFPIRGQSPKFVDKACQGGAADIRPADGRPQHAADCSLAGSPRADAKQNLLLPSIGRQKVAEPLLQGPQRSAHHPATTAKGIETTHRAAGRRVGSQSRGPLGQTAAGLLAARSPACRQPGWAGEASRFGKRQYRSGPTRGRRRQATRAGRYGRTVGPSLAARPTRWKPPMPSACRIRGQDNPQASHALRRAEARGTPRRRHQSQVPRQNRSRGSFSPRWPVKTRKLAASGTGSISLAFCFIVPASGGRGSSAASKIARNSRKPLSPHATRKSSSPTLTGLPSAPG